MALGALSLVDSSGVVLSSGSAMQPVNANTGSQLQKMSPIDSMKEVFFDIRDGIGNLGSIFSDKIGGLNKHLAFRLETLNNTMSNIGNIAAKDLGLEETQTKIDIENQKDDDLNDSLSNPEKKEKGPGILAGLKDGFSSLMDALTPKSDVMKLGLLGLGVALIMTQLDKISGFLADTFKYISEVIMPKAKLFFKNIKENIFAIIGNVGKAFKEAFTGIGNLFEGALTGDAGMFLTGMKQIFFDLPIRLVSIAGDAIFTVIESFTKAMGIDAPWIGDIKIAFRTLPEAIDKVITDTMKFFTDGFDKLTARFTKDGLVGALTEGFRMFYDNTIGFGLNLLYDISGAILKLFGAEKLGEFFQDADFTFDGIKRGVKAIFAGIEKLFNFALDGVKGFLNGFLPPKLQIPLSDGVKTPELIADEADQKKNATGKYQSLDDGFNEMFNDNVPAGSTQANSIQKFNETYTDKIVKESSIMKEKQIELNKLETVKNNDTAPGNITVVTDAKKISGDTVVANNTTVTNHRVDSIESSSNALLQYFRT